MAGMSFEEGSEKEIMRGLHRQIDELRADMLIAKANIRALGARIAKLTQATPTGAQSTAPDEMLDARRAAEFLGISRETLYRALHEGRITAQNASAGINRPRWRFTRADLAAYTTVPEGRPPHPG